MLSDCSSWSALRLAKRLTRHPPISSVDARAGRAGLPWRVVAVDRSVFPGCGTPLVLRCFEVKPPTTTRILAGLQRATGPTASATSGDEGKRSPALLPDNDHLLDVAKPIAATRMELLVA